jgi:hypothetical protein
MTWDTNAPSLVPTLAVVIIALACFEVEMVKTRPLSRFFVVVIGFDMVSYSLVSIKKAG